MLLLKIMAVVFTTYLSQVTQTLQTQLSSSQNWITLCSLPFATLFCKYTSKHKFSCTFLAMKIAFIKGSLLPVVPLFLAMGELTPHRYTVSVTQITQQSVKSHLQPTAEDSKR